MVRRCMGSQESRRLSGDLPPQEAHRLEIAKSSSIPWPTEEYPGLVLGRTRLHMLGHPGLAGEMGQVWDRFCRSVSLSEPQ